MILYRLYMSSDQGPLVSQSRPCMCSRGSKLEHFGYWDYSSCLDTEAVRSPSSQTAVYLHFWPSTAPIYSLLSFGEAHRTRARPFDGLCRAPFS